MPEALLEPRRLCAAEELVDGGAGVRFAVRLNTREIGAFVVRYDGAAHGYLNQCAHVPMELDWQEGQFFDSAGLYLMCATHGATYAPDTGLCVGGPCKGAALAKLRIEEREGAVFWLPEPPFFPLDAE
ncbi:MAG: Rieske (2Fe-2S) protein [Burkholderiaceae bacterium]|jgi:nitrite reductase/ring-hydroxylating ferredoxin subunit|uniref:Rieske (2Fe-2S) protein n=1 Tax=Cupriavidus metallidurans TaxID=119219 RepID=A0A482IUX7_9BURK|nr:MULTISPECIES: Rieske 2Fe-2S domain-containing protein [Cupriavidus]KWR81423.1 Rieske (2Fe-2S) protein [Cupriavidus sp. SHE]PCH58420.1 MAG: Rieske (2Fe-2S) protein [Burkholderiaceae bacterium]QBP10580.1 Rieske (2Fe-2S) protein [Cupriavidus metallidurans]QWC87578.1 Rieske 2Fe-2S domain-containing protein [Cupriavidus metallidurans]